MFLIIKKALIFMRAFSVTQELITFTSIVIKLICQFRFDIVLHKVRGLLSLLYL